MPCLPRRNFQRAKTLAAEGTLCYWVASGEDRRRLSYVGFYAGDGVRNGIVDAGEQARRR